MILIFLVRAWIYATDGSLYLAALYASTVVLKKVEDVTALTAQLECGAESGHLNTFWVFVAGLLESDLCEELFCVIAQTDMQKVRGSVHSSASASSAGRGDVQTASGEVTQETKTKDGQDLATVMATTRSSLWQLTDFSFCFTDTMK